MLYVLALSLITKESFKVIIANIGFIVFEQLAEENV